MVQRSILRNSWAKRVSHCVLPRRRTVSLLFRDDPDFFEFQRFRQPYLKAEAQNLAYSLQTNIFRTPERHQDEIERLLENFALRFAFPIKVFPPVLRHFYGHDGQVSGAQVCCNIVSKKLIGLQRSLQTTFYEYGQDWHRHSLEMSIPMCHITSRVSDAESILEKLQQSGHNKEMWLTVVGLYLAEKRVKEASKPFEVWFRERESQDVIADLFAEDEEDFNPEDWQSMLESRDILADLYGSTINDSPELGSAKASRKRRKRQRGTGDIVDRLFAAKPEISIENTSQLQSSGENRLLIPMKPLDKDETGPEEGSPLATGMIIETSQDLVGEEGNEHSSLTTDSSIPAKDQILKRWSPFRLPSESVAPPLEAWKRHLD